MRVIPAVLIGFGLITGLKSLAQTSSGNIVISQICGGGGNSGTILRNDFIELFNRSDHSVNISGWTVQYASATGTSWDRTVLTGTLSPGQYYLIQEAEGAAGNRSLPTPDAIGGINLSSASGKIALVSNATVLAGSAPAGTHIVDFVGYGSANSAEDSPTPALSNTTAVSRKAGGCTDTNNNSSDFAVGAPDPRNTHSPVRLCLIPVNPEISPAGVTNAASFVSGSVSPGEMITIFGIRMGPADIVHLQLAPDGRHLTTSLAGTRVLFDGVPAPLIYAMATQVTAVVPYSVSSRSRTEIQVEYNGRLSNSVTLPVATSSPGIFTLNASGRGQAAILNQDYSGNQPSRPAAKGSVVMIYATGGGDTAPSGEDGLIATADPPRLSLPVSVRLGGTEVPVEFSGVAPYMVGGVIQINAKIPADFSVAGEQPLAISIGPNTSQAGVTIAIAGDSDQPGTGEYIEDALKRLTTTASVLPIPEIPTDSSNIPADWLALISWNIQVGGTSTSPDAARPPLVSAALEKLFGGSYQILAVQEVPSADSAEKLMSMLPSGATAWRSVFFDSTDTMDNGFWSRGGITVRDALLLFTAGTTDASGRLLADSSRALHPPTVAQFEIGDFDFTAVSVHLTFADGESTETAREMRNVLDYLDWYFADPDHDPDVLVCGDFNLPSVLSGQTAKHGMTLDSIFQQDPRFQSGERRFVVTVHESTSRSSATNGGLPANNYDHCVLSADMLEEFVQARRIATAVLTDHPDDPEVRLTSDHFPIVAFFFTRGERVRLDSKRALRRP